MEMHKTKLIAEKRRAKLLVHFNRLNAKGKCTITKFASLYNNRPSTMTRARMSKLLMQARDEAGEI